MKKHLHITAILLAIAILAANCGKKDEAANESAGEAKTVTAKGYAAAQKLNESGMEFYKKKDYWGAAAEFKKAIEADPTHKLANYNLACVYALLLEDDLAEPSGYTVIEQLEKAIKLDPNVKTKAAKDSDFNNMRRDTRFMELVGLLPQDSDGWKNHLTDREEWVLGNCGGGIYNSLCDYISFKKDNTFRKKIALHECFGLSEEELKNTKNCTNFGKDYYIYESGKYDIRGTKAVIEFESGKTEEISLPIPDRDISSDT